MTKAYEYDEAESRKTERTYQSPEIIQQRVAIMDALNLQAGERAIDVGCGPGLLTFEMALAVGDNGHVIGFDNSDAMLEIARRRCDGFDQARIIRGDATKIDEQDESFDAVACIQVLLYVASVQEAIAEMHRVLRPGGRIVIMETDWGSTVMNSPDDALTKKIIAAWDLEMPNPKLSARMAPMLRKHGFGSIKTRALPILNTSYVADGFSVQSIKQFAESAQKFGISNEAEATNWLESLRRLGEDNSYFFCVNRFLFSAIKL